MNSRKEMPMDVAFTDRELDVMAVLWEKGGSTVAEVQGSLEDTLAYTTVLTILRTLEEKGRVRHEEEGRAYRYFPLVDRAAAGESAVRRLVRKVFADEPEALLTHLVSDRKLTREQLRRMRRMLDERLEGGPER
jgi:predicted transcriptional regulator